MKLGIISDIHGNYPALSRVIYELRNSGCNHIISLGDVCGYYSMINECIDLLRRENVVSLKGNHDSYLLGEGRCPRSNSVNRCIDYQKSVITDENLLWVKQLKIEFVTDRFRAVHGGWNNHLDEYIECFDFLNAKKCMPEVSIFLTGHTHKQVLSTNGELTYCNPGSVGQPRDYDPKAAYAILDDTGISLHRTVYCIDEICEHMHMEGFTDYFFTNLYHGKKIGEK